VVEKLGCGQGVTLPAPQFFGTFRECDLVKVSQIQNIVRGYTRKVKGFVLESSVSRLLSVETGAIV